MAGSFNPKALIKAAADAVCLLIAAVPAGLCRVEARFSERGDLFVLFGQAFSLVPGLPGNWLRRAFGRLTLDGCAADCEIGFLSWFSSRHARIGARVYIGPLSVIGDAVIGDGSLIATRVSILSGRNQHAHGPDGSLIPFSRDRAALVTIGRNTWIGEGAIVMADVGDRCIVASGAVVTAPVESGYVVGGNPARVIRPIPAHTAELAGNGNAAIGANAIHQEEKGKSMA
ncbi:acetyltransferase-like isoleucine patch superfamily enzyme [Skermanella aerolata]|uniref:acyltransferase n=1 Tax=Skermanella aerolata TaxID=393310 RepID=UPI003D24E9F8